MFTFIHAQYLTMAISNSSTIGSWTHSLTHSLSMHVDFYVIFLQKWKELPLQRHPCWLWKEPDFMYIMRATSPSCLMGTLTLPGITVKPLSHLVMAEESLLIENDHERSVGFENTKKITCKGMRALFVLTTLAFQQNKAFLFPPK